jgi:hypothetical protein
MKKFSIPGACSGSYWLCSMSTVDYQSLKHAQWKGKGVVIMPTLEKEKLNLQL